ncbi:MAG: hypothetical protein M0R75_02820 [Dehalococcoidia bacterium]|nr:hypothetical protein [Dehalococcoidia bacterium]
MNVPFDLQATETVTMVLRRHWLHLYPRLALLVLVGVAPPIAVWFATDALVDLGGTARLFVWILGFTWAAFWLVRAYFLWYRYEHDVWVLTDQRLVDSLRKHWFHHHMASVDLVDIEDVAVAREGPLRTMFNYGDVQVQTAAQRANFVLGAVPKPSEILTTLDAARDAARRQLTRT